MVKFFNIEEFLRLGSIDIKLMDGDINPEDHQRMKYSIEVRKENVNTKLASFRPQNVDIEKKCLSGYFRIPMFYKNKKKKEQIKNLFLPF